MEHEIDLPSSELLGNMTQAMVDMIDGNESFELRFASGVLYSCGMLTNRDYNRVDGNEGFFDTIGKGLKKVWEYIMVTLRGLWALITFNKKARDLNKERDELIKQMRGVDSKVNFSLKDLTGISNKLIDWLDRVENETELGDQIKGLRRALDDFNPSGQTKTKEDLDRVLNKLKKPIDELVKIEAFLSKETTEVQKQVDKTDKLIKKADQDNQEELKSELKELKTKLTDLTKLGSVIQNSRKTFEKTIDDLAKVLAKALESNSKIADYNKKHNYS